MQISAQKFEAISIKKGIEQMRELMAKHLYATGVSEEIISQIMHLSLGTGEVIYERK